MALAVLLFLDLEEREVHEDTRDSFQARSIKIEAEEGTLGVL